MRFFTATITFLASLLLLLPFVRGTEDAPPYNPSQFSNVGIINDLTVMNQSDRFSGGTITIDGIPMIIPKNSYVTLPSISVQWSELFSYGVPQLPQFKTAGVSYEATVYGNRVGDSYVVGLVYITQSSTRIMQGFINQIDLATGQFWVSGNSGTAGTGIKCRLNDPVGRYGVEYHDYPLWTVDAESPSITASTGFPVCIPRYANGTDDPLCPLKNRIVNGQLFTAIQFKSSASRTATDPDPNFMAPLRVGDYVTMNGIEVGGGLLAVYSLDANLGLYTAPGELPAYIKVEEALTGVPGPGDAEIGETRAVAFTTDPSTSIQFYAIDVDPCTGMETERALQTVQPLSATGGGLPGKTVFRLGKVNPSVMTKNVGFKMSSGTVTTANDLKAGVFIQPIFGFIFPELLVFGNQMFPFDFGTFPFLAQGSGPFIEAVPGPKVLAVFPVVGPLSPWPGATTPATTSCTIAPVTSIASAATTTMTTVTTPTGLSTGPTSTSTTPQRDTISILSVTSKNGQGTTRYTISAKSSQSTAPLPVLTCTGTGVNPLGATTMTSQGGGNYILDVAVKHGLDTITVTSSLGGSMTLTL